MALILKEMPAKYSIVRTYTALGHKLRFFRRGNAQFVAVGIIESRPVSLHVVVGRLFACFCSCFKSLIHRFKTLL